MAGGILSLAAFFAITVMMKTGSPELNQHKINSVNNSIT
jgi:hypothetical protein